MYGDITLAAERLYLAAMLDIDRPLPGVDIALRDIEARRQLEMLAVRALADDPSSTRAVAEAILVGAVDGSGGERHRKALDRFRSTMELALPPTLLRFLDYARRPSRWGDWLAGTTLPPDDEGGLARILVQMEVADGVRPDFTVEVDRDFGAGAEKDAYLERSIRRAVVAATSFLLSRPAGVGDDVTRVSVVRVFRGGLPWPFAEDGKVPTPFEREQAGTEQRGPSVGLAVALAVIRAFLPAWSTRPGPPCVATGDVRIDQSIELVGGIDAKGDAAVNAGLPLIVPAGSLTTYDNVRKPILPAANLREAVDEAFNLIDERLDRLIQTRPKHLFGRNAELQRIRSAWLPDQRDHPELVLVTGESGIGKSGLLATVVAGLVADEIPILFVDAYERSPSATFVRRLVRATTRADLRKHVDEHGFWLATVAEELLETHPDLFRERPMANQQVGIARQAEAMADLLARAARAIGHLTIVIDNLQDLKEEDWRLLLALLDSGLQLPTKVLGAYRETVTRVAHSEPDLVRLRAANRLQSIELDVLAPDDLGAWLGSLTPELEGVSDRVRKALQKATGGRAYEMSRLSRWVKKEMVDAASVDLALILVEAGEIRRQATIDRKEDKEDEFVETLSLAAVSRGLEFEQDVLLAASGKELSPLLSHLIGAQEAGLIAWSESAPTQWEFTHEKDRNRLLDRLSVATRAQHHLAMGGALERLAETSGKAPSVVDLAHHFVGALPFGPVNKAAHYKGLEADEATRRLAYGEAKELRLHAVRLLDEAAFPPARLHAEALLGAAVAYSHLGLEPESKPYFGRAIEVAKTVGYVELVEAATVGFSGPPEDRGAYDTKLMTRLQDALADDDGNTASSPNRTRIYGRLMFERVLAARRQPERYQMPPVEDFVEETRAKNDLLALAWALNSRLLGAWPFTDTPQLRIELAEEMLAAATATGEKDLEIWGWAWKGIHLLELGRREEAELSIAQVAEVAKAVHHGYARWGSAVLQPMLAHLSGRVDDGLALAEAAFGLRSGSPTSMLWCGVQRMLCLRELGRIAEIEPIMTVLRFMMTADQDPTYEYDNTLADSGWALLCCELARFDEAREIIRPIAAKGFQGMLRDPAWPTGAVLLAEACTALGDPAPALYDILLQRSGEIVVVIMGVACLGSADRYLGLLAATAGKWEAAENHFLEAVRMNEMVKSPLFVAHSQCDHASMLLAQGLAEDLDRARELNAAASAAAAELGLTELARRTATIAESIDRRCHGESEAARSGQG
jgi:tetratricopeptide (TPR) repeat protein